VKWLYDPVCYIYVARPLTYTLNVLHYIFLHQHSQGSSTPLEDGVRGQSGGAWGRHGCPARRPEESPQIGYCNVPSCIESWANNHARQISQNTLMDKHIKAVGLPVPTPTVVMSAEYEVRCLALLSPGDHV
jgi:hypothetical protein